MLKNIYKKIASADTQGNKILIFAKAIALPGLLISGLAIVLGICSGVSQFFFCLPDATSTCKMLYGFSHFFEWTFYCGIVLLVISGCTWAWVSLSKKIGTKKSIVVVLTIVLVTIVLQVAL